MKKQSAEDRKYFDVRGIDPEKVYITIGKPIEEMKMTAAQACAALAILLRRAGFAPIGIEMAIGGRAFTLVFVNPKEEPQLKNCYSFATGCGYTFEHVEHALYTVRLMTKMGARRFGEVKRDE